MLHAMIDLETLGTGVDCVVLSCGVVTFDETGSLGEGGHALLDLDEQFSTRKIDVGTLRWWMKQKKAAQDAVFTETPSALSVNYLHLWLRSYLAGADRVWSQGANFDLAILEHMFRQHGLKTPWKYNAVRDTRTMYDLLPPDRMPVREGTHHNALDDARHQARCVIAVMQSLRSGDQIVG